MTLGAVVLLFLCVTGIKCQSSEWIINGDNVPYVGKWPSMVSLMIDIGEYNGGNAGHTFDIAVLRLEEPLELIPGKVEAAHLAPNDDYDWAFHNCYVVGWGRMGRCVDNNFGCYAFPKEDCNSTDRQKKNYMQSSCMKHCGLCDPSKSTYPDDLQEAATFAMNRQSCQKLWGIDNIKNLHICAYDRAHQSKGSCNGDSGGPFFCQREGTWYQAGVFSWMHQYCYPSHPSVYGRVTFYKDWINEKTGINFA